MLLFSCFLGFQLVNRYFQFVTQELNCSFLFLHFLSLSLLQMENGREITEQSKLRGYSYFACLVSAASPRPRHLRAAFSLVVPSRLSFVNLQNLCSFFFLPLVHFHYHPAFRGERSVIFAGPPCPKYPAFGCASFTFDSNRSQKLPEQTRLFGQCDQNHLTFCQGDPRSLISARNGLFHRSFHHWCVFIIICSSSSSCCKQPGSSRRPRRARRSSRARQPQPQPRRRSCS